MFSISKSMTNTMHYTHKRSYITSTLAISKVITRFEQGDPSFFEIVLNNEYHISISPFLKIVKLSKYNHEKQKDKSLKYGQASDCVLSGDAHLTYIKHAENVISNLISSAECKISDWDKKCWIEDINSPRSRT